jgi:ribosomal protein S27E
VATQSAQRSYQAPCPGCGAPVNFASAQSTHAVCGYCQSSIVRSGEVLTRIGKMAELFDDHSPLQLQTSGTWDGQSFTLVGRLQYKYAEGTWTEWMALLADGSNAYLSEDNGAYVFAIPQTLARDMPPAERFKLGATTAINGESFSVASNQQVMLQSAQGELPHLPALGEPFAMVELRSLGSPGDEKKAPGGRVLSIDYSSQPATITLGQPIALEALKLSGLREASVKNEKGRQFNCPNCGASVVVTLASSQSVSCPSCSSLIDVSGGIGGELKSALQDEPVQPVIPLGTVGQLQGVAWQVVGFQHRMGTDPSDPDEQFGWEEYLLYNQQRGFSFLVDSTDGWSVVKPATGAPVLSGNGQSASYLGQKYQLKERYKAETTYALGEFYWQVQRGQLTDNSDYAQGGNLLSREQSANEVVWSVGSKIDSDKVAAAFKLDDKKGLLKRSDVGPFSSGSSISLRTVIIIFVLLILLSVVMSRCSDCDPKVENCASSSRSSGGSFGGFSSGGGHK